MSAMPDGRCPARTVQSNGSALDCRDLGLVDYRQALAIQHELRDARRDDRIGDTVLIVEHPPVITLGARNSANKLLVTGEELGRREVDLVEVRRGGGTTVHNPGQLVFYPIVHLQQLRLGVTEYVRTLEAIGIDLLRQLGVGAERRKGFPGLWVADKKIASVGVRVSRSVTCHGMAINICNDLSLFELVVPCGLEAVTMTSVAGETGRVHDMADVRRQLVPVLVKHLGGKRP